MAGDCVPNRGGEGEAVTGTIAENCLREQNEAPWGAVGGNDRECSSVSHISQLDGFVNVDRSRFPTTQAGERR